MRGLGKFKLLGVAAALGIVLAITGGLVISQAAGGQSGIRALVYNDVVRFTVQNEKVEILRAEVFDLGGKRLFDSGPTMGNALDWAMTTEAGERVAHGVYLYVITAWDSRGELLKSQVGKLALVPGGVGLGQAPALMSESEEPLASEKGEEQVKALAVDVDHSTESWAFGQVGIGTTSPSEQLDVQNNILWGSGKGKLHTAGDDAVIEAPIVNLNFLAQKTTPMRLFSSTSGGLGGIAPFAFNILSATRSFLGYYADWSNITYRARGTSAGIIEFNNGEWKITSDSGLTTLTTYVPTVRVAISADGNVGIGTANPSAGLEINRSSANLLLLRNSTAGGATVFRVEKDGDVRADGAYYSGTGGYYTGSADVAERINTSEWVEQGNVVEIDPEHPGFFRKTSTAYSTNVAGIISTDPGVILGNNFDAKTDKWEDNRPMLALAGRVPVKVTAENGSIQVGDLLVSSSTPGYAMRCADRAGCVGATIGKALESLEEGTGVIMVQVSLR